jgi:hypothetical protein
MLLVPVVGIAEMTRPEHFQREGARKSAGEQRISSRAEHRESAVVAKVGPREPRGFTNAAAGVPSARRLEATVWLRAETFATFDAMVRVCISTMHASRIDGAAPEASSSPVARPAVWGASHDRCRHDPSAYWSVVPFAAWRAFGLID